MSFISLRPSSALWSESRRMVDLAEIADSVPEWDEPRICECGKHYMGAPCPEESK